MKVEAQEVSPGEEAGIKSASFIARGRTPMGALLSREGRPPARARPRLSTRSRAYAGTAFAGVEVAPLVEDSVDVEIEPDDIQIDTYRASGAVVST